MTTEQTPAMDREYLTALTDRIVLAVEACTNHFPYKPNRNYALVKMVLSAASIGSAIMLADIVVRGEEPLEPYLDRIVAALEESYRREVDGE